MKKTLGKTIIIPLNISTDSLEAIKEVESLKTGCCVIVGGADVGKSPVLRAIADKLGTQAYFMRFGEPLPGYLTDEEEAARTLLSKLIDPAVKVICLDSIKDLVASIDGALMARGVPRILFRMISQWGAIASTLGKTIIIPLNISTDSLEAIKEVESAVSSNATTSVFFKNKTAQTTTFEALARTGEARLRETYRWTMRYPVGNGANELTIERVGNSTAKSVKSGEAESELQARYSTPPSQELVARALLKNRNV